MGAHPPVVAIVDDDLRLLESLDELLESAGYVARVYPSAAAFLARGLAGVDLLITDIGMPGMDGFDLRDRALALNPDLPVFLITGRYEIADQNRARSVDGLFCKPFDADVLLTAIGKALGHREEKGGGR